MKKKVITKNQIMKVFGLTIDTQPFYETKGFTHLERMISWFEVEGYNITENSIKNIDEYIKRRKEIMNELMELSLMDLKNNLNGK
jgi:N-acetylglutamate synthase-like GNAT family acetyltransferase